MTAHRFLRSRLIRWIAFIVGLFVFVEIGLQVVAYSLWSKSRSSEQRSEGDGPVVLCVGDSMTHGLGSSTPMKSYPGQLETKLRSRDSKAWVVVNGAWPGRDSLGVLERLPDQLEQFRPDYVCCLVGINDAWSGNDKLTHAPPGEGDSFPIVWRTGRLIEILLQGQLASHGEEAFVGIWHKDDTEVDFQPNGRLMLGLAELRWLVRDGRLIVVPPTREEAEIDWRVEGDKLHLGSELWPQDLVLTAGPATELSPVQRGERALAAQQWTGAVTAFGEGTRDDQPVDLQAAAREGLVTAYLALDDRAKAGEQVAWLEQRDQQARAAGAPISAVSEALIQSLIALGEIDEALGAAARLIEHHAESLTAWRALLSHGLDREDRRALVLKAHETGIEVLSADRPIRNRLLLQRGLLIKDEDPEGFLRALFEAVLTGAEEGIIINHLHMSRDELPEDLVQSTMSAMDLSDGDRDRLREVYQRALAGGDGSVVLIKRLEAVLELCRQHGAELLLLDYPFQRLDHERVVDGFAADKKVRRVRLRPRFDRLLETLSRDDLFIRNDVHCNDRGYGEMAKAVTDTLLAPRPQD